jgi:hypothetical protein
VGGLLVALGLALPAAPGQEPDKPPPRTPVVRKVYVIQGGSAKELARVITRHFQAEPGFRAVPAGNKLLLSGGKDALEDALAVLREIDRPARTVRVEVLYLELAAKADKDAKPLDVADLSGNAREVRAKIRDLQQKGIIRSIKKLELTALAGESARTQVSENKPWVTGVNTVGPFGGGGRGGGAGRGGGGGMTTQTISYRNVGTSVRVKPALGADEQVILDLLVENSAMRPSEGGAAVGNDDKGIAIPAAEFVTFTLETRVRVRPGKLVQATNSGAKAGKVQTIVLVGASMEEGGQKGGK